MSTGSPERRLGLVTLSHPLSPQAEAYRQLCASILFLNPQPHTICVTSPNADEGKSLVLANLAVCLAQGGNKVIIVDAEIRHPRMHVIFDVDNATGLSSFLAHPSAQEPPVQGSGTEGLSILTSGPTMASPTDVLGSQRWKGLLDDLRTRADYVLVDTPPPLATSKGVVLASLADGVLLTLKASKSRKTHAQKVITLLQRVNARLLGLVLTDAELQVIPHPPRGEGAD